MARTITPIDHRCPYRRRRHDGRDGARQLRIDDATDIAPVPDAHAPRDAAPDVDAVIADGARDAAQLEDSDDANDDGDTGVTRDASADVDLRDTTCPGCCCAYDCAFGASPATSTCGGTNDSGAVQL